MSREGRGALAVGLIVGVIAGALIGVQSDRLDGLGGLLGNERPANEEALDVIEEEYFKRVDADGLENASIRGMVRRLRERHDDRFSHYFDPEQLEQFEEATSGSFSGVGLSVRELDRGLRVTMVFDGTPADAAGIEEGDLIVAVDGKSIAGEPADVATAMIKGPPGTSVRLGLLEPDGNRRTVEVERAEVQVPVVQGKVRRAGGRDVAYVRLAGFSEGAHGELRRELNRLYDRGAEGFVLDLRGNGGGLLNEAVLTASVFIDKGVIVSTKGRAQPDQEYRAVGDALDPRPAVVLIDRDTASAAEILASALKERGLATVVGTRSFGKGVFQEVIELESGGAIDLTVGEYLTSRGRSLAGKGIQPQVEVKDEVSAPGDEALRRGLQVLGRELREGQ